MSENLSLGKKGQYGEIDFSKIRSGIKKDELLKDVDKKLKPVFEQILSKIDSNPNDNMLSRSELEAFFAEIKKLAGEGIFQRTDGMPREKIILYLKEKARNMS